MILTGKNLGDRQKELNFKVKEAAINVNFEEVKNKTEKSDIDKLFKIDLASKLKNLDYILEVLKSGDNLYISRALKCVWMYDDEFSTIVNTGYLHSNIFPFVSMKMKKKILTSISMYVRDETRAANFFLYCKDNNLIQLANKFIANTSESFKLDIIQNLQKNDTLFDNNITRNLNFIIGNSFILADAYLQQVTDMRKIETLHTFRYLYFVCDVKYLDMLEKHTCLTYTKNEKRLGLRISKNVIMKHKNRVLKNPLIYVNMLNTNKLVKYCTIDEFKIYLKGLLPDDKSQFWAIKYGERYKDIINMIPSEEKYKYLKNIFSNKYPGESFETELEFYNQNYHNYMTYEERNIWALNQAVSQDELFGSGQNYIWYKYVEFDRAFEEIKNIILVTYDASKRAEALKILVESAKNEQDLEKLLNYYYERHVNENRGNKERFLAKVYEHHKVLDFNEACWIAYNKLLYSLEVYNMKEYCDDTHKFRVVALIYHIIHHKKIPADLEDFMNTKLYSFYMDDYIDELTKVRRDLVYNTLLKFYVDKMNRYEREIYNDNIKSTVRQIIKMMLSLMKSCDISEKECPEIMKKYMELDAETFQSKTNDELEKITQKQMIRLLKQNATLVTTDLSLIRDNSKDKHFRLNQFLRKLKVYFSGEFGPEYLSLFKEILQSAQPCRTTYYMAVYGIFQLADENFISDLMTKHVPVTCKINRKKMDESLLYTQESICRFVCYSRPPVLLSNILPYIKGDYLKFCLPMFDAYLANLPPTLCLTFVESMLNTSLAVQKHGIRLAFQCFSTENLKTLVLSAWNKSRRITWRRVIYTSLFNYILHKDKSTQLDLFEVLKKITLDLCSRDHKDVLALLTKDKQLPEHIKDDFWDAAWLTVSKFPQHHENYCYKYSVLEIIRQNLHFANNHTVQKIIEEHVQQLIMRKQILKSCETYYMIGLDNIKMQLMKTYICKFSNNEGTLNLVKYIIKNCLEMWDEIGEIDNHSYYRKYNLYVVRYFCFHFISDLINYNYSENHKNYAQINVLLEAILQELWNVLPIYEIYIITWKLKIAIITNKVLDNAINRIKQVDIVLDDIELIKDIAKQYASELNMIVNYFLDKNLFHLTFLSKISDIVVNNLKKIFETPSMSNYRKDNNIHNMYLFLCIDLANFNALESILLAIYILPISSNVTESTDYQNLLKTFGTLENGEIHRLMYDKFVKSGFKEGNLCKRIKLS